jgi:hypothetical protein
MVDWEEFGSGGNGFVAYASEVDLAATTTGRLFQKLSGSTGTENVPAYPFFARSMATCLPIPREAPTTNATFWFLGAMTLSFSFKNTRPMQSDE